VLASGALIIDGTRGVEEGGDDRGVHGQRPVSGNRGKLKVKPNC